MPFSLALPLFWLTPSFCFLSRPRVEYLEAQQPFYNSKDGILKWFNRKIEGTLMTSLSSCSISTLLIREKQKKMWYIYTMEYYSAIKKNEIGSFVETWMDLETVIQSEVSQKEQNKYILMHICGI